MQKNIQSEQIYIIRNEFLSVEISNLGASIRSIRFADRELTLGFASQAERIASGTYSGAVIGRVANRIAGGKFALNGVTYHLTKNEGENTLHGGEEGFDRRFYTVASHSGTSLVLAMSSPDGDQGFSGRLETTVSYSLNGSSLVVDFSARCDKDSFWSPTLHTYFRLGEEATEEETYLQINAESYTPMDEQQIPTGKIEKVAGTPLDFRLPKKIGEDISAEQLRSTCGYDHNFVLNNSGDEEYAAAAFSKSGGVRVEIFTDMSGLHFYSGNFLKGFNGTRQLRPREGFALEPQFFPNAVNETSFESPLVKKGTVKKHYIKYKFQTY